MKSKVLRYTHIFVVVYLAFAFAWWSVFLFRKNSEAYEAKIELLKGRLVLPADELSWMEHPEVERLIKERGRKERMILSEALAFIVILLAGLLIVHRVYQRVFQLANIRRNFLLSITHELKSPIASIRLILQTLQKRELPRETSLQLYENGLDETLRLQTLVENLLLSARLETAYQPHFIETNILELLEKMILDYRRKFPDATIEWIKTIEEAPVQADLTGIHATFSNLLENAIKYSTPPADIVVKIASHPEYYEIQIADKGVGIPDPEKKKIFDKFYRIGNEDIRKTKGTGLGLYIANQVVRAHRGALEVKDNYPTGSIFTIKLPKTPAKQ